MDNLEYLESNKYLIRYYYVYKFKNLHRAAEEFYLQSTDRNMRYAINQLENFYNIQLIKTEGNKISFTEFGHILGKFSEQIYNVNLSIYSVLQRVNFKEIRFATSYDFYKYYIEPIFAYFQKEYSDAKIMLIKTNQHDSTNMLSKGEIDFIVGVKPDIINDKFEYQTIAQAKILLAIKQETIDKLGEINYLKDLKKLKGAMNDFTDPFYEKYEKADRDKNIKLNIVFHTSEYESLIGAVLNDFVDYAIVGNYTNIDGLVYFDISEIFAPTEIAFIYRKGEAVRKALKNLIDISQALDVKPSEIVAKPLRLSKRYKK